MSSVLRMTESKFLERCRTALTNAESNAQIKELLAEYGMDSEKIAEGNAIYLNSKALWEKNKSETAETKIVSNAYKTSYENMQTLFKRHRNQSLIFFKKKPDMLIALGVKGSFPNRYNQFFDKVSLFYNAINNNAEVANEMRKIKITPEVVADCLSKLNELLAGRAKFDSELGESQNATVSKDAALIELKNWMDDFDAIAKIALYDSPQLLESLGIVVRM